MSTAFLEPIGIVNAEPVPSEKPKPAAPPPGFLDDDGFGPIFTNPFSFD